MVALPIHGATAPPFLSRALQDVIMLLLCMNLRNGTYYDRVGPSLLPASLYVCLHQVYGDANHKPEMALALEDFEALAEFAPVEEVKAKMRKHGELVECCGEAAEQVMKAQGEEEAKQVCGSSARRGFVAGGWGIAGEGGGRWSRGREGQSSGKGGGGSRGGRAERQASGWDKAAGMGGEVVGGGWSRGREGGK